MHYYTKDDYNNITEEIKGFSQKNNQRQGWEQKLKLICAVNI